jgi:superfamily II DNA helicase RecQ
MKDFMKLAGLPQTTKIIRAPTNRLEHSYNVVHRRSECKSSVEEVVSFLAKLVQQELLDVKKGDRGIIFVRSMNMADDISGLLEPYSATYYSRMEPKEKSASTESWRQGNTPWMVATSAFIQGVDYPRVQSVIFADLPYGLIDFVQGAGRGGRSGLPTSIYLVAEEDSQLAESDNEAFFKCFKQMNHFKKDPKSCRRYHLSDCMDGKAETCSSLEGAEKCDICCPTSIYVELGKRALDGNYEVQKHQVMSDLVFPAIPNHLKTY